MPASSKPGRQHLRHIGLVLVAVGIALCGTAGAALSAVLTRHTAASSTNVAIQLSAAETGTFEVTGHKPGLYPGATSAMALEITNPNPFAIQVDRINATATSDAPTCPVENITFGRVASGVIVPASGTAKTDLPVALAASAEDGCQGVTFRLAFTGNAVPAPGVTPPAPTAAPSVLGSTLNAPSASARPGALARTGASSAATLALFGFGLILAGVLLRRSRPTL